MKRLHRFPEKQLLIATEAGKGYFIAYRLDYFSREFDPKQLTFGYGHSEIEAIECLTGKIKRCA